MCMYAGTHGIKRNSHCVNSALAVNPDTHRDRHGDYFEHFVNFLFFFSKMDTLLVLAAAYSVESSVQYSVRI